MRGADEQQGNIFSYINVEERIPQDHPLRQIRVLTDGCLKGMWVELEALYSRYGRPSIPPERLLRALLLQALYSVRSERQLMEQLDYNLLFRWFVGLNPDDPVWDVTVFTKNRERMMEGEVSQRLLAGVVAEAARHQLLSEEHFTVDGTLIEAWASRGSFVPKDPPPTQGTGTRGRRLLRDKVESTTDPEARLYKKSMAAEARPSYLGHVLMENRHGLVVAARATESSTWAEREACLAMLDEWGRRPEQITANTLEITLGGDRLYQEEKFLVGLRQRRVIPHIAEYSGHTAGRNGLLEEERAHPGFAISQRKRKLVEQVFGWAKLDSIGRQVKVRGQKKVDWFFRLVVAAANLVRMRKLIFAVGTGRSVSA